MLLPRFGSGSATATATATAWTGCGGCRYFTPATAIDYGLIDRIVRPQESVAMDAKDYEGALAASQRESRARAGNAARSNQPQTGSS